VPKVHKLPKDGFWQFLAWPGGCRHDRQEVSNTEQLSDWMTGIFRSNTWNRNYLGGGLPISKPGIAILYLNKEKPCGSAGEEYP
jgi:hypothetical protein